jgi:hypothetical protein
MKKFGTFGKVLAGLTVTIVICIATRRLWGRAAGAGIRWICQSIGVPAPEQLLGLIEVNDLGSTQENGAN